MWQPVPIKSEATLPVSLAAALLLALPVAAQNAPSSPTDSGPAKPAVTEGGTTTPAGAPALESPALGPLGGRDTARVFRPSGGGAPTGFATVAPGLGVAGIITPFDLGNRSFGIRPSIGADVLATNRLSGTGQGPRREIVTTIAPSLEVAADTLRLSGYLRYTPGLRFYGTNWNGVDQVGDGRVLAALFPGLFYLDVRGAASVVPTRAGQIPGSGQAIARDSTAQTYTAQVTPFLVQRFGTAASVQVGYSFQYARQNAADISQPGLDGSAANYTGHRGFAVLRSGEDFGRLALQARVDGTWYVGDGIYDGARYFVTALEARYAILRTVAVFGEVGYEKQRLAGTNPLNINGPIGSVGVRLTPTPDSIVIARFGRQNGFNSFSLNAGVDLGARTSLFATYREALSTPLSQSLDLLGASVSDTRGDLVDSQSGAPVVLIDSFLGLSDTLYRTRLGTASLRYSWPRDVFTLSGTYQSRDPVSSSSAAVTPFSSRGAYATFSWTHEFSPRTTGGATLQYGRLSSSQAGRGNEDIYAAAATISHELTDKLTGGLQVAVSRDTTSDANQSETQFAVRAGLRRSF